MKILHFVAATAALLTITGITAPAGMKSFPTYDLGANYYRRGYESLGNGIRSAGRGCRSARIAAAQRRRGPTISACGRFYYDEHRRTWQPIPSTPAVSRL